MGPHPSGTSSAVGAVGTLRPYTCRGERLGVLPVGQWARTLPCPDHRPCQQPDARSEGGWGSTGSAGRLSARSQCFPWNSVVRRRLYKCKEVGWAERNRLQLKTQRLSVRKMLRNAFSSRGNTQDKLSMFYLP